MGNFANGEPDILEILERRMDIQQHDRASTEFDLILSRVVRQKCAS